MTPLSAPVLTPAGALYNQIFQSRTAAELLELARIKRFLEVWSSDDQLRDRLEAALVNGEAIDQICAAHKIDIDPRQLQPIFRLGHAHLRGTPSLADYPLALAWDRFIVTMLRYRDLIREQGDTHGVNLQFDTWRKRQITRCQGELRLSAASVVHPVVAFELSDGCSVGCWFCGISADKFKGYWPYEANRKLWREILGHTVSFFGAAAATGFCYWATDPCDNPDYPAFIDDFYHATGTVPQTTTAAPLKDVALTRRVLELSNTYRTTVNRFSVLNKKGVRRIHEAFTADELLGVELVLQNREATSLKANAGRARLRAAGKSDELADDHTTLACVTGFLVKLPAGLVQLVTPCRSSDETPDGYYIHAERRFSDGATFAKALRDLQEFMTLQIGMDDTLALRRDLKVV